MATVGTTICGTGANQLFGDWAWTSPGNITARDSVCASATITVNNQISDYLRGYNFGFTIPTDATINGIVVDVWQFDANAGDGVADNVISIGKNGSNPSGDNKAAAAAWDQVGGVPVQVTYGGATDIWAVVGGLTPAEVNSSNFSVYVAVKAGANVTLFGDAMPNVDSLEVTVYYTPVAAPEEQGIQYRRTSFFQMI
jgi:hypothetical protein